MCSLAAVLGSNANVVTSADSAYMNDDFALAARLYEQATRQLGPSADRYYNTGNAYYRLGQPGRAIVNYERALRLDPTNRKVLDNLEFVNEKINSGAEIPESFVSSTADKVTNFLTPNTWAIIGIVMFLLTLTGLGLYFFSYNVTLRKVGFFGSGVTLILCIAANWLSYRGVDKATAANVAVIVKPSSLLSTSPRVPRDRSEEAMRLNEGLKVTVLDSISTPTERWFEVSFNNHRAWIPGNDIEII